MPIDLKRGCSAVQQLLRQNLHIGHLPAVDQHHEFVPAHARHGVLGTQLQLQPPGQGHQDTVANTVAQ